MTWSLVAHDPDTGAFAVAVATCAFAVGASCPHLRAGVGAVSTQSFTNRYLGPIILDNMARGWSPEAAIRSAVAGDDGRGIRQVHAVDRHGRSARWTGANCVDWAGDLEAGPGISIAGNMLAGPAVLAATRDAWVAGAGATGADAAGAGAAGAGTAGAGAAGAGTPLPERLLAALDAGEAAGGDRRGRQSAALVMTTTEDFPDLDLRVDDHAEPLAELRRLLGIWRRDRAPFLSRNPSRANPAGFTDLDAVEAGWIARGLDLRFRR